MIPNEYVYQIEEQPNKWKLYFDGFECIYKEGESIILVFPSNDVIYMEYKLKFDCTNNIKKYGALILEMNVIILLKIKNIKIYSDS